MTCVKSYVVEHSILNISLKAFPVIFLISSTMSVCLMVEMVNTKNRIYYKIIVYEILNLRSSYVNIKIKVFLCVACI